MEGMYALCKNNLKLLRLLVLLIYWSACPAQAESLTMWISSFQDQTYYEQMADLYAKKSGGKIV